MGRSPSSEEKKLKKGPWTPEEDEKLIDYMKKKGHGNWKEIPKHAGLNRCGKSCRLRWTNYLRPDIIRGTFSQEEEKLIIDLHALLGNKWSRIATHLPGRTDNEIKNYWNTRLRKKLLNLGINPTTHQPITTTDNNLTDFLNISQLLSAAAVQFGNSMNPSSHWENALKLQADAAKLAEIQLLSNILQIMKTNTVETQSHNNLVSEQDFGKTSHNGVSEEPMQGIVDSWASFGDEFINENEHIVYDTQKETAVPHLVSGSPQSGSSTYIDDPAISKMWEFLMEDDDTSDCYWKNSLK